MYFYYKKSIYSKLPISSVLHLYNFFGCPNYKYPFYFIKYIILRFIIFANNDCINFYVIKMAKLYETEIQDILLMYAFSKRIKRENRGKVLSDTIGSFFYNPIEERTITYISRSVSNIQNIFT